jgi:hypothetical protein
MIFRALFAIGLVALLMPREPDLGLGRPGADMGLASPVAIFPAASGLSRSDADCAMACAGGRTLPAFLAAFGRDTRRGLAEVKAEIDADRRARAARSDS